MRKLTGREGWRPRVSLYRLIFEIDDAERFVTNVHKGHRKNIFSRKNEMELPQSANCRRSNA